MIWGFENASVAFGTRTVLDGVTLGLEPSSVSVVVGGDGAGKSTMLRALVGLVRLNGGKVLRPPKNQIGFVPSTAGLYKDLTVDENLSFVGRTYGVRGKDLAGRSSELLERTGLDRARSRLAGRLSGGMQRKLALGLALLHRPALLALDEPTTGVDPVSRAELWRLISAAAADGTAVIAATTYVDEAGRASEVVLLERGKPIAVGSPGEIIAGIPGKIGLERVKDRPEGFSWRWGADWRVWAPSGHLPDGAEPLSPTFEDAVMVAELNHERRV